MNLNGKRILVTGGASFIGSHLTDALVDKGAKVRVVDNLSSGRLANIQSQILLAIVIILTSLGWLLLCVFYLFRLLTWQVKCGEWELFFPVFWKLKSRPVF